MDVNGESRRVAPGGPGLPPRWTRGAKDAVGTAYSTASRVWYTVAAGILTEVFYPTIDTPQIRDLQFLVTDGKTFFHDERRNTRSQIDCVDEASLGFTIVNEAEKRPVPPSQERHQSSPPRLRVDADACRCQRR